MLNTVELQNKAIAIRLLVLDVDGILTDGRIYYGAQGEALKVFNTLDGHGLKMLMRHGVQVAIITGRKGDAITSRAKDLGIQLIKQGREDKFDALLELLQEHPFSLDSIACMGDDWPDLTVMTRVGLALTVPNAHPEVKTLSHWQSQSRGGEGAVREACDLLLKAQGNYQNALSAYSNRE